MALFCWHDYKVVSEEELVTVMFIFMVPTGKLLHMECKKCGKKKTKKVKLS